jgi:hypothetical protein
MMQKHKSWVRPACQAAIAACVFALVLVSYRTIQAQAPSLPQSAAVALRQSSFRAVSYDVSVSLSPSDQVLSGKATVEFESREPSSTVECELHPNLKITAVRDAATGKPLSFDRDNARPLRVRVLLADPVTAGQRTKVSFEYAGPLANEENSPVAGVRMAWIGKDGAYLLLPARWFPLTDYPSNRYTGVFRVEVPNTFVVVGTGTSGAPTAPVTAIPNTPAAPGPAAEDNDAPVLARNAARKGATPASKAPAAPARKAAAPPPSPAPIVRPLAPPPAPVDPNRHVYTFHVDRPSAAGTFVAGALQLFLVQAEGINISVYAPPSASATAQPQGEAVAHAENIFSDRFGPLPDPSLTLAQLPDGSLTTYDAPGLLLVSQRQWQATPNVRQLAALVASQWWGNQVMAASPADAWLTAGLSRYSEALYVEQTAGTTGMNKALEDFAIGSLMFDEAAPIAQASRLEPFTPNYDSVVRDKGAMVFHMLRGQMGDAAFFSLLHDFLTQYSGKAASLEDFEALAQAHVQRAAAPADPAGFVLRSDADTQAAAKSPAADAPNLRPFFVQWVNSTGVPEFSVAYTVYRIKTGFKVVGKVKQNLDFFRMPVEMEIQTEGNPEYKTLEVTGNETSFDFDVFGRPKSNGITLDPHNFILKSSAKLRVRGVIARGEALAEVGRYYDAVQQYNQALEIDKGNPLATFRIGEAFFYQKNYSAAANAFREASDGDLDLTVKWIEVWSHIYLGKIYDISGDRARAVNEYGKAQQTNDNTGGAQDEIKKYLAQAYSDQPGGAPATGAAPASVTPSAAPANSGPPVLKRRE